MEKLLGVNVKNSLKLFVIKMARFFLKVFYVFPVKDDAILFSSFEGRQYSDSPKYLYEYIRGVCGDKYNCIWVLNSGVLVDPPCEIVKFLSIKHIYYLMTARYIVSNLGIEPFVPKRKKQVFVNTWHGSGAYKSQTLGDKMGNGKYNIDLRDYRSRITDFYVSGCQKYSDVMSVSWNVDIKKFIPTGLPRNDIFFKTDLDEQKNMILQKLNLSEQYSYILFAPTFRGTSYRNHNDLNFSLDVGKILNAFWEKFGKKFKMLFRAHIGYSQEEIKSNEEIIDVSAYPDMQEIMIISDALITDYSSSMWDFSLLNKPGFLYVPDLEEYTKERDFYTPIETWPFPFAKNNEELVELIMDYSTEKNSVKIKEHQNALGNFETGSACKQIVEYMGLN